MQYVLYQTMNISKRYVIKSVNDKPPCACAWEEKERFETLYEAIEEKRRLEAEQE